MKYFPPDTAAIESVNGSATTRQSNIESFTSWLGAHHRLAFDDYHQLHEWSIEHTDFWSLLCEYFSVPRTGSDAPVTVGRTMPDIDWFPGLSLNYVDQVLRHESSDEIAIIDESENADGASRAVTWAQLRQQVHALAAYLRTCGVGEGDRVVGYLPNIPEAVIAFLATAALGAVWSSCGQDYSAFAASDRLGQLDPTVLITADGYRYNGKICDRRSELTALRDALPTVHTTIVVDRIGLGVDDTPDLTRWERATDGNHEITPVRVPFDHPLWVLFSSGTTGRPKGIVHGHGGVVLEHLKQMSFHLDLHPGDVYFWYTSPSWMMWNFQIAGLLVGATIVTYDGSASYPGTDALWSLADRHDVAVLGTSPAYLQVCEKAGLRPGTDFKLGALRTLGATGSVLAESAYTWVAEVLGDHIALASTTGGTDIVSAFAGAVPTEPIVAGELSVPCLGVALEAWDHDGNPVVDQVGELVVTRPLPSMPLYFWNDPDRTRYRDTYFDRWPGVWRHGDWITTTARGTVVVHGRSDATLNRNGVRMGSADIYQAVEALVEVREALVLGVEYPDGEYWMPLFVVLADDTELDEVLRARIVSAIRQNASPKHIPDDIVAVPHIPHTKTGKKIEIPLKRLMQGADLNSVVDPRSVDNASHLQVYASIATEQLAVRGRAPSR